MIESFRCKEAFSYTKLTEEECKARGILGRLKGVIAESKNATRNGRLYSKELWEKVFENPIMKEKIDNRCCYGELCHPQDREEIDMEKIAVCLAETPKFGDDGKLYGIFDILDTPNGRILKTLCDYGCNVGVSSRGTGDLITDEEGNEIVDPDTYDCECFDIVLVPAVESARLIYVTESLEKPNNNVLNLTKALSESIKKASAKDRKVMEETLHNLNIDITTDKGVNIDGDTSKQTIDENLEANDDGTDEIIKSLQEAIKDKTKLEEEVKSLQEKLAVSNAKVSQVNEELDRYKSTTVRLSKSAKDSKDLSEKVSTLEEQLKKKDKLIENLRARTSKLLESNNRSSKSSRELNETVNSKDVKINKLNESLESQKNSYEEKIKALNEELTKEQKNSSTKVEELSKKVAHSNKLVESYKKVANEIVERYIGNKATMLGVSPNEIKNKLNETYTIDDIDKVCEGLQTYSLNISKLPFSFDRKVKVQVTESKEPIKMMKPRELGDDDIDEGLLKMAGLNK